MKNAHPTAQLYAADPYTAHCYATLSFATLTWPWCGLTALGAIFACSDPPPLPALNEPALVGTATQALRSETGRRLFQEETFAGNGRTCATCHGPETGTLSPEEARQRYRRDSGDPAPEVSTRGARREMGPRGRGGGEGWAQDGLIGT